MPILPLGQPCLWNLSGYGVIRMSPKLCSKHWHNFSLWIATIWISDAKKKSCTVDRLLDGKRSAH
jgi:hypothetical protein